ncbi:MAG: argininosuccinate synthase [Planctomycetota bacterium]|jgi:argininosuccinate synthase|nr:argininosuccinate synthase [Planctomycetota bacterium]
MRVLLAYSGGLDTSFLVAWLTREQGHEVTAATVDCGGFSATERVDIARRALELGAVRHEFIDAKSTLFDSVLRWLIAGNVRRGGVYPLCVGAERALSAELLAERAVEGGFDALAHGCTAAGNDQVRFEATLAVVAPDLQVLAPVRDLAPSREAQVAWLAERGLEVPGKQGRYSINAGLWGLTIGGGETLNSHEPLPEDAWVWTRDGGGEARMTLTFAHGVPISIDGVDLDPVELIETLNRTGGALGCGRGYHLGDTVLGIKGRIGFEAPAATLLLDAHRELEKLVLTEEQRAWKDQLGEGYGRRLHQGLLHDPAMRDMEAFFASSQAAVCGRAHVAVRGGSVLVEGVESPYSLLAASDARYGERPSVHSNPAGAAYLGRILAEPARLARRAAGARAAASTRTLEVPSITGATR